MLQERGLRITFNDKQSLFNELLNKHSSISIHIRNIQGLAIEMFKFYKGLFKLKTRNLLNSRQVSEFSRSLVKTVYHETESMSYLGPKIWDVLPQK